MADAQYFSLGQDPASIRWKIIHTEYISLIFSGEFENQAQRLAVKIDSVCTLTAYSGNRIPRRIPLVIHNRSVISNGVTSWAPRRMEFFSVPPQDSYAGEWMDQLMLHEYRHVVQISALNRGMTRWLGYLLGEQAVATILGLYVPSWFLEGDAVVAETAFSRAGRGRLPSFGMPLKAQVMNRGIYSYDKAVLGSFRDFIPDPYTLGYHLTASSDPVTWQSCLERTARKPLSVTPFSSALRKSIGRNKASYYYATLLDLQEYWSQSTGDPEHESGSISPPPNIYTDYETPRYTQGGDVICYRKRLDDIGRFVRIVPSGGNEEVLFTPGNYMERSLDVNGDLMVWTEYNPDPRWNLRSHSVICCRSLTHGKTWRLTKRSRLFSPDISPDGSSLVAVSIDEQNRSALEVIDMVSGATTGRYLVSDTLFYMTPAWAPDGRSVIAVVTGSKGKGLIRYQPGDNRPVWLLPMDHREIFDPECYGSRIFFTTPAGEADQILALDTSDMTLWRVTSARYGAAQAAVHPEGRRLVYMDYTPSGYALTEKQVMPGTWDLNPLQGTVLPIDPDSLASRYQVMMAGRANPPVNYPVRPYRKGSHLFNLHSWAPLFIDVDNTSIDPGFSVMSQNHLSTLFITAGYQYLPAEGSGKLFTRLSYRGWYPVFDLESNRGRRKINIRDTAGMITPLEWIETNLTTGFRLPLTLRSGKYTWFIQPWLMTGIKFLTPDDPEEYWPLQKRYIHMDGRLYTSRILRSVKRDIYPRWGQMIDIRFMDMTFDPEDCSRILAFQSALYFPGFFCHHAWRLYGGWQQRQADRYFFSGILSRPRGYASGRHEVTSVFSVSYAMPLLYPDISVGSLVYLKRIKTALFLDLGEGTSPGYREDYLSAGCDLSMDVHFLRLPFPADTGIRTIWLPDERKFKLEFLFSVSFDPGDWYGNRREGFCYF
ncbi:MAG: hypothetical protein JW861_07025 [Bacteroidales bacterium]|nr:hypothetical protein [Bacteroidales bacterium]